MPPKRKYKDDMDPSTQSFSCYFELPPMIIESPYEARVRKAKRTQELLKQVRAEIDEEKRITSAVEYEFTEQCHDYDNGSSAYPNDAYVVELDDLNLISYTECQTDSIISDKECFSDDFASNMDIVESYYENLSKHERSIESKNLENELDQQRLKRKEKKLKEDVWWREVKNQVNNQI